ncbi:MAG: hypothetical protein GC154_16885 [bacterium]|nr:hypothetical protein [bacterium]
MPRQLTEYRRFNLPELIERVVQSSDRIALNHFHEVRPVFCGENGRWIRLAEYLDELRAAASHDGELADHAYDLTLDKFHHLPEAREESGLKPNGPDCRLYFSAYLRHIREFMSPERNALEKEAVAASLLQRFVKRHFHLSVLECRRRLNRFTSRYDWIVNGQAIRLWFPKSINGADRRKWLEVNIEDPDPNRRDERERIQREIDNRLQPQRSIPFQDDGRNSLYKNERDFMRSTAQRLNVDGVAETIAREKCESPSQLRPSIRVLAACDLQRLIHEIFESICSEDFDASRLARGYGLSPSTLSRFAGIQWDRGDGETSIPDLWLNTARVFAHHPVFREAAEEAGMWNEIRRFLPHAEKGVGGA